MAAIASDTVLPKGTVSFFNFITTKAYMPTWIRTGDHLLTIGKSLKTKTQLFWA
jgi:hypothetical protein